MTNITLSCKQCGHDNESQRIYCHNCGAKLDRIALPQDNKPQDSLKKQQARVRKLTNPANGFFVGWQRSLLNTLLCSIMAAAIIQSVRQPDGVPPERKKGELLEAPQIELVIEDALATHLQQRFLLDEAGTNAFLALAIKKKNIDVPFFSDALKFDRLFIVTREGECTVFVQHSLFGYRFWFGTSQRLEIRDGKLKADNTGGSIGRLPIHPLLMQTVGLVFEARWNDLRRERKLLDQMQSIEVHKGRIILVTRADSAFHR